MKSYLIIFIQSALFTIFIAACENSHEVIGQSSTGGGIDESYVLNPTPSAVLLSSAQTVFTNKCNGCHAANGIGGQISLTTLIQDGYVIQGPASASILFKCVNSSTCINRMGQNSGNMIIFGGLNSSEADTITAYIDDLYLDPF